MQIKLVLKPILAVIVVFLATSNAALANESSDYIDELLVSDAFHPPGEGEPGYLYNEWHYFNMIDDEQNLSAICTFKLNGGTNSSRSPSGLLYK